jgi:TonB family protein
MKLLLTVLLTLAALPPPSYAQAGGTATPSVVIELARRTARTVAKAKPRSVLIAPGKICLLDAQLCDERNTALRSALRQLIPSVKFIDWQSAVELLPKYGLLQIDAYLGDTLYITAPAAGADVLVMQEANQRRRDPFTLYDKIFDLRRHRELAETRAVVPLSVLALPPGPVLYQDPITGIYIDLFDGYIDLPSYKPQSSIFHLPSLAPGDPAIAWPPHAALQGANAQVELRATITPQGVARQIGVVENPDPELTRAALLGVANWRYKPAIYKGKPIPFRVQFILDFASNPVGVVRSPY